MVVNKAIFLDKDGTLIQNIPFNTDPEKIILSENMIKGLKQLMKAGYELIVVSNQSGIAHGYFEKDTLIAVEKKIDALLRKHGIYLSGFYYCPHHPDGVMEEFGIDCECRKPKPGLLLAAAKAHRIDLHQSWMIGDVLDDIEAGNLAGCRTVLINDDNETLWEMNNSRRPHGIVKNINKAAAYIFEAERRHLKNENMFGHSAFFNTADS